MADDKQKDSATGNFQDPLEDFEPKKYADALEKALAERTVAEIQSQPYASVFPDTPVAEAVEKLAGLHVACLLVEEEGKLIGVFSDRNVLDKVALEFDAFKDRHVREVMTENPVYVYETDSAAAALSVMAVSGYRHVPVVDVNQKLLGIVSPQRVAAFLREHAPQA